MPVIVEDGSIVAGANSYVSETYAVDFAQVRGLTLPTDSATLSQFLVRATDFVDSYASRLSGTRTSTQQEREWPRVNSYDLCGQIPSNSIPKALKDATVQIAVAFQSGFDPTGVSSKVGSPGVIKREVGPLRITYTGKAESNTPDEILSVAMGLLKTLFRRGSNSPNFVRV